MRLANFGTEKASQSISIDASKPNRLMIFTAHNGYIGKPGAPALDGETGRITISRYLACHALREWRGRKRKKFHV